MAKYNYDEAGNMAAYFLLTFLTLTLAPLTFSAIPQRGKSLDGCQCKPCVDRRRWLTRHQQRFLKLSKKFLFLLLGWSLFAFVFYRVMGVVVDNKLYDPFEILGINAGTPGKEIKSHYKRLSLKYHPDKVKATANETIEMIQEKFVQITKAYKALTDETIRKNWELYGNPDGYQEMSMGIALPRWIVESKNNVWVLGLYGLLFGGALPALVGSWWFGSREITKDGIRTRSATEFFKSLHEESNMDQVIATLGKSYSLEHTPKISPSDDTEIQRLLQEICGKTNGMAWKVVESLAREGGEPCRRGLILVYAHMLRIEVKQPNLVQEQVQILQQTPALLSALLNITLARDWLFPALDIMRLHAYLVQGLFPFTSPETTDKEPINPRAPMFVQLPGISSLQEANSIAPTAENYNDFVHALEAKNDNRLPDIKKALSKWGHVDLVDATFKVIGERVVFPSSIVYLVVKLRLKSPIAQELGDHAERAELDVDKVKQRVRLNEEQEEEFLRSHDDAEELDPTVAEFSTTLAHAPCWPDEHKPSWWIVLADGKANRVVIPPLKIADIPYARLPHADAEEALFEHDYRTYKIQFQAPPDLGVFIWKLYIVSDTFVGEDVMRDIIMEVDEDPLSAADVAEDEISDPDEDTLAGQMAAMRGGGVKKRKGEEEEESDDSFDEECGDDCSSASSSDSG